MNFNFLLKTIFVGFLFVQFSFADSPREHRGFYSSTSFGFGYLGLNLKQTEYDDYDYKVEKDVKKFDFNGFTFPALEFKFGTALANIVAFHTVFGLSLYSGICDYSYDKYYREYKHDGSYNAVLDKNGKNVFVGDWERNSSSHSSVSNAGSAFKSFIGFGTTVYPFTNPKSAMNGAFIGAAVGTDFVFLYTLDEDEHYQPAISMGTGFQVELGKDWWVNDHLSLGVSLTYGHSFLDFAECEGSENSLSLNFRLTRG